VAYCSIVTGAGQGIGLALAKALAYAGSDLVLTERNAEHLEAGASKIKAIGRKVTTVACDVAADDTPDRLVQLLRRLRLTRARGVTTAL
jgi:short-subunit dehydrogenase